MPPILTLTGQSGIDYAFMVLSLDGKLPDSPGVYVLTSTITDQEGQILHHPISVGSCTNLSKLLDQTEIQEWHNKNVQTICIRIEEITEIQHEIEQDLKRKYQLPKSNTNAEHLK